jgi:hypothetical protein
MLGGWYTWLGDWCCGRGGGGVRRIGGGCLSPVCDVGVMWVAGLVVPHGAIGGRFLPLSVESGPFVMLCVALSM